MAIRSIETVVGVALAGFCAGIQPAVGAEASPSPSGVRPVGASITDLVAEGRAHSATFRSLLENVDSAGWIVFVQAGSRQIPGVAGCLLHRVGEFGGRRYLRIVLSSTPRMQDELIATIGHELQHAAEVVGDPRINEAADIRELYRRRGYVSMRTYGGHLYETRRAIRTGAKVLAELRSARRVTQRMRMASR